MEYVAAAAILVLAGIGSLRIAKLLLPAVYALYYGIMYLISVERVLKKIDSDIRMLQQNEKRARCYFEEKHALLLEKRRRLSSLL